MIESWIQKEIEPEEWEWEQQPAKYYIRSTVLGGAVVTDVYDIGTKKRTYVRAGGQEIAWQNGDSGGSVVFQATDPVGASIRSAESDGDIFDAQGTESSPAELDPMGGNVATENPFVTQTGGSSCVGCGLLDETMPLWAMGGEPRITHNGFPISQEEAAMLIDNGLGMPSDLVQHMNHPNFRFQTFGFGMYRAFSVIGYRDVSPMDPEPDGDGPIAVSTAERRIWEWRTHAFYPRIDNPNCITKAIPGSRLTSDPNEMIVAPYFFDGTPPDTSRNDHDGVHILDPTPPESGTSRQYDVFALSGMAGKVLHYGFQTNEKVYSILDIQLNLKIGKDPLVLTIKDMVYKNDALKPGQSISPGQMLGIAVSNFDKNGKVYESAGIHVTLMTLSTYRRYISAHGISAASRRSVPIKYLIDAYKDAQSPFRCP
ncbi:MAG: hypothetical protein IPM28_01830 [Chloracidobacterium sp.]|nr:hypothetical protein [Chloracidobacterium sp.]